MNIYQKEYSVRDSLKFDNSLKQTLENFIEESEVSLYTKAKAKSLYSSIYDTTLYCEIEAIDAQFGGKMKKSKSTDGEIDDMEEKLKISIYPNPVNTDYVSIVVSEDINLLQVSVIDATGRIRSVNDLESSTGEFSIPIKDLENGVFFLKLKGDEVVETHKIIVNN